MKYKLLHTTSLFIIAFTILYGSVSAQISITANDLINQIGTRTTLKISEVESVTVNVGSAGANQTWDFSSLSFDGQIATADALDPVDTPFFSEFPEANFTEKLTISEFGFTFSAYTYFAVTPSNFSLLGDASDVFGIIQINKDNSQIIDLPLTFGSNWTTTELDTVFFDQGNKINKESRSIGFLKVLKTSDKDPQIQAQYSVTKYTSQQEVDAWGTLQLPTGSFSALRIKQIDQNISEIYNDDLLVSSDTTRSIGYTWVSKTSLFLLYIDSQEGETNPNFSDASSVLLATDVGATAIGENVPAANLPGNFNLEQNYPNPFNPLTTINYSLPIKSDVKITIYDISGRLIESITPGVKPAGSHQITWRPVNDLASGTYLYRLQAGEYIMTKKMILLR